MFVGKAHNRCVETQVVGVVVVVFVVRALVGVVVGVVVGVAARWLRQVVWRLTPTGFAKRLWWLSLCTLIPQALAAPDDFASSKRLAQRIYADESQTFYCGCPLRWQGGKGVVDLNSCGYAVRKNGPRAQRIEWEHVMPAQQFGAAMRCWQQGGREQCAAKDARFQAMEADLFNLKPAIGEINADRAHYRFALLPDVPKQHGQCDFKVDFARDLVEPRAAIRGDIARIYFYMSHQYAIALPSNELQLMLKWHQADPVDARERQLHQRIAQHMGRDNPFVSGKLAPEQVFAAAARAISQQETVVSRSDRNSDDAPVHGNKASKRFHLSHCPSYHRIASANLQRFANQAEAVAAGYQLAGNCKARP